MYKNTFYEKFKQNVHSQNGEDGVVSIMLHILGITSGWICEFGAWDGIHLSNTFLLTQRGFHSVLIESDKDRYVDLLKLKEKYNHIFPINALVSHLSVPGSEIGHLDSLLATTEIPIDFDLLSIDIDSYDLQVWETLKIYKPKIVIIEINSGVSPFDPHHIHDGVRHQGAGFLPMLTLGRSKGYTFFLHTGNMIFVRNDLAHKFEHYMGYDNPIENFRRDWQSYWNPTQQELASLIITAGDPSLRDITAGDPSLRDITAGDPSLRDIGASAPQRSDIKQVPTFIISPDVGVYADRKNKALKLLSDMGFTNVTHYKSRAANGNEMHTKCIADATVDILSRYNDDDPVLILEDDVDMRLDSEPLLLDTYGDIPTGADALYLGISTCAGDPVLNGNTGQSQVLYHSKLYSRVINMLSAHAILYLSKKYKEVVINQLSSLGNYEFNDVRISRIQKDFNIYCLNKPLFYQAPENTYATNFVIEHTPKYVHEKKSDLRSISTVVISPDVGKYVARKINTMALLTKLGFTNVSHYKSRATMPGEMYTKCLVDANIAILSRGENPVLIIEDDIHTDVNTLVNFKIPDDADALYFGISSCAGDSTLNMFNGQSIVEFYDKTWSRVINMLGTHAILYLSKRYKEAVVNKFLALGNYDHADVCISRIQKNFNVYCLNNPLFYQAPGARRETNFKIGFVPKYTWPQTIFVAWLGDNAMTENRIKNLKSMPITTRCNVTLITQENLHDFIPTDELHPAYQYLSFTQRADYLRTYLMHHVGGGYCDIKEQTGSWLPAFEYIETHPDCYVCGYPEFGYDQVAGDHNVKLQWQDLIGNGAFVFNRNTPLTQAWYSSMIKILDLKLEALKLHPATSPQDSEETGSGYPIQWNEIAGRIFHPLLCGFKNHVSKILPRPKLWDYR